MIKMKAGIEYKIKDNSIIIGTQKKGNIKNLFLPLDEKTTKGFTLKEVLEEIISKARKQYTLDFWHPCPRNIGRTIAKRINNLYSKIEKENQKLTITENKKYIEEAEKIIYSFNKKKFNEKLFRDESLKLKIMHGRDELEAQKTNRLHIEMNICTGLVKKIEQGSGENEYLDTEHKRVSNKYIQIDRVVCPHLEDFGDGVYRCNCKTFTTTNKNKLLNESDFE
jgi:hypothetical protein